MRVDEELKVQLARQLCDIIDGWPQIEAASMLNLHQPDISALRSGRHEVFSVSRLLRLIASRGYNIEVRLGAMPKRIGSPRPLPAVSVLRFDRHGMPATKK